MSLILALMALISTELLQERVLYAKLARTNLLAFSQLTTPVPADHMNPRLSKYVIKPHHALLATHLQRIQSGEINRLEIELPPRHGKSKLSVHKFVPWFSGKTPEKSIIIVTHTDDLAREHGREVRDIFRMGAYRLTFPDDRAQLRDDTQSADLLKLVGGGQLKFSGRGGLGAGVGADLMIFDDFFKNSEEAESETTREHAWHTFISDCQSRLNTDSAPIILIGTRRHVDDVQGRLFDPTNEHYDETEASRWTRIRLPALAESDDLMGREINEPLWPEKYGRKYYLNRRNHKSDIVRMDHQTQDQCNPMPEEGKWFKKKWLKTYTRAELPKQLRIYIASDHAYRIKEANDASCLLVVGMDPTGELWVLPDTIWSKMDTAELCDAIFKIIETRKPAQWWAARDAISGSIMPLLRRRMFDTKKFFHIDDDIVEKKDLVARSSSIRGLMAMGLVHWPIDWPQWAEAEKQLVSFPGAKDDLVAALAMLGMGLDKMTPAEGLQVRDVPKKGTLAWHTYGQNKTPENAPASWWKG